MNVSLPLEQLNAGQRRFLLSQSPYTLLAGGFGSGKTTVGALKILQLATLNRSYPGLVLAPTWTTLKSVVIRALRKLLLMSGASLSFVSDLLRIHDPMQERYLNFGGGTHVFLRSMHDEGSYDGLDVAWVYGDEMRHASRHAYEVAIARARVRTAPLVQRAFTSTPQLGWMSDEFNSGKQDRELITVATRENLANLSPGYEDGLRQSYSKRVQRAILDGQFTVLEGSVYEAFDVRSPAGRAARVIPHTLQGQAGRKTYLWIDPGFRRSAFLWVRHIGDHDRDLRWCVVHQWMPNDMPMTEAVIQVNAWNAAHGVEIDEVHVDPAADNTDEATGIDVAEVLDGVKTRSGRPRTLWVHGAYRGITFGVDKLSTLLGDPDHGIPIRLFFSEDVVREEDDAALTNHRGVVKSLESYAYPEVRDGRPVTDVPLKDGVFDHSCDASRYGAVLLWLTTPLRDVDPRLRMLKHVPLKGRY